MLAVQRKLVLVKVLAGALIALLAFGAADKIRLLQEGRLPAGSRVVLSPPELRQWLHDEAPYWASFGVTNIRFTPGTGRATGSADIDFLKARKAATGQDAGWLLRNLFSGQRPVTVTARFSSAAGRARVDVEHLEVNGIQVKGPALDLLMREFVTPNFPDAKLGVWFPLDYRVDHFTVTPLGIAIHVGK